MTQNLLRNAEQLNKRRHRRKRWQQVVGILGCFVVFCTTYALILPAITLEYDTVCQQEEHQHTLACYEAAVPTQQLICQQEERTLHTHSEACYEEQPTYICAPAEGEEHTHTEECLGESTYTLICEQPEVIPHTHTDDCYDASGQLCCTLEEVTAHTHDAGCYVTSYPLDAQKMLTCTLPTEDECHTHDEACYEEQLTYICALEEGEEHTHTEECLGESTYVLVCQQPEVIPHTHTDDCYDASGQLCCGLEELILHTHGEECYSYVVLTCTIPEHSHTDECRGDRDLTGEEQAAVEAVILAIDALPTIDEVKEQLAAYDDSGDTAGRDAYLAALGEQIIPVFDRYDALTEEQKAAVTNAARLVGLKELLEEEAVSAEETPVYYCGQEAHAHDDTCLDTGGNLICELSEHSHSDACLRQPLTQEEQAAVDALDALVDTLPSVQEIQEQKARLEEAGDVEGLDAYMSSLCTQVGEAKTVYDALTDPQKARLKNREKLEELIALYGEEVEPPADAPIPFVIRNAAPSGSESRSGEQFPFRITINGEPVDENTVFYDCANADTVLHATDDGVIYLELGQCVRGYTDADKATITVEELVPDGWQLEHFACLGYHNAADIGSEASFTTDGNQASVALDADADFSDEVCVTAYNEPIPDALSVTIPLSKQFQGAEDQLLGVTRFAVFSVEQVQDADGNPLNTDTQSVPGEMSDVTLECDGQTVTQGGITINYPPDAERMDYFYRIREESYSAPSGEIFIRDDSDYIVKITVTNESATITAVYKDGAELAADATAAFVNTLTVVRLPDTGAAGTQQYIAGGLTLMCSAVWLLYKQKKRGKEAHRT